MEMDGSGIDGASHIGKRNECLEGLCGFEEVGIYKGKQGCWIKKCEQCVTEGYGNKVQVGFFHLCRFLFRKRKNK